MRSILNEFASRAESTLRDDFLERVWPVIPERAGPFDALNKALVIWAEADARPLVLLIDESIR